MSKYQHLNQTKKMIVSLAVHIDCFACASCFLSAILACSHPFLRRQLSGHTIDTMLFTCRLSMHSPSLCIEGHVPTSYCITTDPSALLTPWHSKIPCARDDWQDQLEIVGGKGYSNTLSLAGMVPNISQITAMNDTTRTWYSFTRCFTQKIVSCWAFKAFRAQDIALMTFYLFKDVSIRFEEYWGKFKDLSKFFNFQGLFKGLMLFQGPCEPWPTVRRPCEAWVCFVNPYPLDSDLSGG